MKKPVAVAIAVGAAFAMPAIAYADDPWIAMAISDSTGQIKYTFGGTSQADANQTVMQACRKAVSDCRLLASGQGGCVAIAVTPANTKYFGGWGPTREDAEAAAQANSRGGTVQRDHTHCAGDSSN